MKEIEYLLRKKIGLHAATLGRTVIERAVSERLRDRGLADLEVYLKLLRESPVEWEALVESVLVTETWFFRDREPFRTMTRLVRQEWLPAHPAGKLRILSVPCSTGEEPYSIAMALLDAELHPSRFQIDAVDIRPAAIARAQHAEYGKNSFRGKDLSFRTRYFKPTQRAHLLNVSVREKVRFETGNLLDERFRTENEPYDFIFCRNLLMYFERPTQEYALQKLGRLLSKTGALFVGSAEVLIAARNGFVSANLPLSFACRKAPVEQGPKKRRPQPVTYPLENMPWPPAVSTPLHPGARPAVSSGDLATARQLADQGRFTETANICENYLREFGASAEAYYLLGLIRDTGGAESEAGEFYRKALYLEPDHYETLTHLALLSEKSGDDARARILGERAQRIKKQT